VLVFFFVPLSPSSRSGTVTSTPSFQLQPTTTGTFVGLELLSISSASANGPLAGSNCPGGHIWTVNLTGSSKGSTDSVINQAEIGAIPFLPNANYPLVFVNSTSTVYSTSTPVSLRVPSGTSFNLSFVICPGDPSVSGRALGSGQTLQLVIITKGGVNAQASVVLG
jgi:hypothetical protein